MYMEPQTHNLKYAKKEKTLKSALEAFLHEFGEFFFPCSLVLVNSWILIITNLVHDLLLKSNMLCSLVVNGANHGIKP